MKILDSIKKIKRKIKVESRKKSDYVQLDGQVISYSRMNLFKILSAIFFIFSLIIVAFFYSYRLISNNLDKESQEQQIEPIKIVIPYPNNMVNIDDSSFLRYKVKSGDALSTILTKTAGVSQKEAQNIINKLKTKYDIRSMKVGQTIVIKYRTVIDDSNNNITEKIVIDELRIPLSLESQVIVVRNDNDDYDVKKLDIPLVKYYMKYYVDINDSLFEDGIKAEVPANIMLDLIKYYSFDIDFQRDIKKGDSFEILFDSYYTEEGEKVKDGKILYATLNISKSKFEIYRFKSSDGFESYFDGNGRSVQKYLLKTPINGARISSNFGKRKHPILGYTKVHQGIDFAAPMGTPFFAAGDGVITMIGWNGGFGNYIRVRHNKNYSTEYAHISKFASNLKKGSKVRQGQVIAYVGSTGMATGPHLHYGILYNGERINPNRVRSVSSTNLIGKDVILFKQTKDKIDNYRFNTPNQNRRYR